MVKLINFIQDRKAISVDFIFEHKECMYLFNSELFAIFRVFYLLYL